MADHSSKITIIKILKKVASVSARFLTEFQPVKSVSHFVREDSALARVLGLLGHHPAIALLLVPAREGVKVMTMGGNDGGVMLTGARGGGR